MHLILCYVISNIRGFQGAIGLFSLEQTPGGLTEAINKTFPLKRFEFQVTHIKNLSIIYQNLLKNITYILNPDELNTNIIDML